MVRRYYEAFNAEDVDALAATLTEDVELQTARGLRRGRDEARAWATRSPTGQLTQRIELDDLRQRGGSVVAFIRKQWWWREESELAEEEEVAALFTMRDGLIGRWQPFTDRAEALEAAGMGGGD